MTEQTKKLASAWLKNLKNAYYDDVTQQIYNLLAALDLENQAFVTLLAALRTARQQFDTAYKRLLGRDFTSDDLQAADRLQDGYMSVVRNLLAAYAYLPDADAETRRKAEVLLRSYKDFGFDTSNGMSAEASKVVNMLQVWTALEGDCQQLGVWPWMQKALTAAQQVQKLTADRTHNDAQRVKGEMVDARRQLDAAVANIYDLLNALVVVQPTDAMLEAIKELNTLQARAQQFYIGRSGSKDDPEPEAGGEGSDVTPVTPVE